MYIVVELQTTMNLDGTESLTYIIPQDTSSPPQTIGVTADIDLAEQLYHEILTRAATSSYYKHGAVILNSEAVLVKGYYFLHKEAGELVHVEGHIIWDDENNNDGLRPVDRNVSLRVGNTFETQVVDVSNEWSYDFGNKYAYTNGAPTSIILSVNSLSSYASVLDGWNIVLSHTPAKRTITGQKNWDDSGHSAARPDSIVLRLNADGEEVASQVVTANASGSWLYSFNDMYSKKAGNTINYTIAEDPVLYYTVSSATVSSITNQYTPPTYTARYQYDDEYPTSIMATLPTYVTGLSDGTVVSAATPSPSAITIDSVTWSFDSWDQTPKTVDGADIVFTGSWINNSTPPSEDSEQDH